MAAAAVVVTAAPTVAPTADNGSAYSWTPAPSDQTTCDASSFNQAPSGAAADWRHCAALFSSWANQNGTFSIHDDSGDALIPILQSKGCVLGVKALIGGQGSYTVGDQDIKTILRTALQNYSEGTDLEVQGDVNCAVAAGGKAGLHWQIYGDAASSQGN
ncbi:hypothetical protein PT974_01800 [Cladobotryum mycophilum]|uniref:Ecp2 effector protein-like domain-containing protein n=1 Tax=Cladobotryum mycophilum TaxID=491253 RepID=A0ABR0SXG9_9HYPO